MSKIVYLCARKDHSLPFRGQAMEQVLSRLAPDNIVPSPPRIIQDRGRLIGIFNPVASLPVEGCSVCLGAFFDRLEDWWRPGARVPDGSFALFRSDGQTLELATDIVASRTIWYAQTPDLFIAATSQRAIVCFLQSFEPNPAALPWILSSGTLGPGFSWDRRIQCLGADCLLRLDRESWTVDIARKPVVFKPTHLPVQEHRQRLLAAIEDTFEQIDPDAAKWVLPLSGGYDSRAILMMLKNRPGLKTVTWGLQSAPENPRSDARVARELASRVGVEHQYWHTDPADESVDRIFGRFLAAGEGRIDNLAGYMDGFAIWKRLFEQGYQGVLRGDEAFGCRAVKRDRDVYRNMNLLVLSDFANVGTQAPGFDLREQQRPGTLERAAHESREQWRDRVNTEFEIPFVFAALSDLKLGYVEIIQPLLSRRIVEQVRTLPDELRTGKSLFKKIVAGMKPKLGFAKEPAIASLANILTTRAVVETIGEKLEQVARQPGTVGQLASRALVVMKEKEASPKPRSHPRSVERILRLAGRLLGTTDRQPLLLDPHRFAFRVYTIAVMTEMLGADAAALETPGNPN
jgi:hypothetical protein